MQDQLLDSFLMYRLTSPETDSDQGLLAVAEDKRAVALLGDHSLSFALAPSPQVTGWLARGHAPTGERLHFDLASVRDNVERAFAGRVWEGRVAYDKNLSPVGFTVSLRNERGTPSELSYVLEGFGSYMRLDHAHAHAAAGSVPVTLAERVMLDSCISLFAELAAHYGELLRAPAPHGVGSRSNGSHSV